MLLLYDSYHYYNFWHSSQHILGLIQSEYHYGVNFFLDYTHIGRCSSRVRNQTPDLEVMMAMIPFMVPSRIYFMKLTNYHMKYSTLIPRQEYMTASGLHGRI